MGDQHGAPGEHGDAVYMFPGVVRLGRPCEIGDPKTPHCKNRDQDQKENAIAEDRLVETQGHFLIYVYDFDRFVPRTL